MTFSVRRHNRHTHSGNLCWWTLYRALVKERSAADIAHCAVGSSDTPSPGWDANGAVECNTGQVFHRGHFHRHYRHPPRHSPTFTFTYSYDLLCPEPTWRIFRRDIVKPAANVQWRWGSDVGSTRDMLHHILGDVLY